MAQDDDDMTTPRRGISIDALSERVHTQGAQIQNLADDTKSQISGLRIEVGERFSEVKTLVGQLASKLDTAATNSAERSRTNWLGLIGTGGSAVAASWLMITGLLSLRLAPLEDKQLVFNTALSQLVTDVGKITDKVNTNFVPRPEIEANRADAKERRTGDEKTMNDFIAYANSTFATKENVATAAEQAATRSAENKSQILQVRERTINLENNYAEKVVKRSEHELRWAQFEKELEGLSGTERRDVDEVKARLDGLYPASTFLRDLQQRLANTESKVIDLELGRRSGDK